MVTQIDHHEAVLPLRAMAREFHIDPNSADGQMLTLIEQALEFVVALHLGDTLPSELNGGEASWTPTVHDRQLAASHVRHALVRCVCATSGDGVTADGTVAAGWEDDPTNSALLRKAIDEVTIQLGAEDAGEIAARVDLISDEVSYIETLLRIVTSGVDSMQSKLFRIHSEDAPAAVRPMLIQVQMLARRGIREIRCRIAQLAAVYDDILTLLGDTTAMVTLVRKRRDWLLRTSRAWEPTFTDWAGASGRADNRVWQVIEKTYAFLAPRFMSFKEWDVQSVKSKPNGAVIVW